MAAVPKPSDGGLAGARTPYDLLHRFCRELVEVIDASAAITSRLIGELLVQVAEHAPGRTTLYLGQGYFLSDYPETRVVLDDRVARQVLLSDPDADPQEAALLRVLDFRALLMLPFVVDGTCWGLIEIYDVQDRRFSDQSVAQAAALADEAARLLGSALAARRTTLG